MMIASKRPEQLEMAERLLLELASLGSGASKAMAELAVQSYRASFFNPRTYEQHGVAVATTRAWSWAASPPAPRWAS